MLKFSSNPKRKKSMQKALETLGIKTSTKITLEVLLGESFNGNLFGMGQEQIDKVSALRDIVAKYNGKCTIKEETLKASSDAARLMYGPMKDLGHEEVRVAFLNSANRVLLTDTVFKGSAREVNISPREILSKALCVNATGIILYHNHPSSDVRPSQSDIKQTERLKDACSSLDVNLVDHIIIGKNSYFSFADEAESPIK